MDLIKIDGTIYDCSITSEKKQNDRHQIFLRISGNPETLRDLLRYEKHGSCWVDYREFSVLSVLAMITNKTINHKVTVSDILISWSTKY